MTVRGRHEGTLFQRSRDRRWVAMVTMPDGRRRSASGASKAEGVSLLRELLRQRDESIARDPRRLRLGPYLRGWAADLSGRAPATIRQHEMIVRRHLVPALGHRLLTELTPADVEAYLQRADLDPQTRRHHRATLRLALNDAIRNGLVTRNAAALARPPRLEKVERRWLNEQDVKRVIRQGREARLWPLFVLILTTGLRVSEALGLAWSDVDWEARELHVERTLHRLNGRWVTDVPKTRKSRRSVPLVPDAIAALHEQRKRQDAERGDKPRALEGLIFATKEGQPIQSTNVLPGWYRLCAELGLPRVTIHDCRHSAAAVMLRAGVPLPVIAEILGHSSIRVTVDVYGHIGSDQRRAAGDRLAEALS